MRYLDSDDPAQPMTIGELRVIRVVLHFYKRDSTVARLLATVDRLTWELEHQFGIHH